MAKITSNQHLLIQFRLSDRSSLKIEFRVHLFFFNSKWLNFNQQLKYDSIDLYGELLQYQISKLWTLLNEFRTSANSVSFIRQTVLTSWISFSSFLNSKWLNFNQLRNAIQSICMDSYCDTKVSKLWTLLNKFSTTFSDVI